MDCSGSLAAYSGGSANVFLLCYHGSVWRNQGVWGNTEIGAVIYGRMRVCFRSTYTPFFTMSLALEDS